jgi:hypothetical protein
MNKKPQTESSNKTPARVVFAITFLCMSTPTIIDLSCQGKIISRDTASIIVDIVIILAWLFIECDCSETNHDSPENSTSETSNTSTQIQR